MVLRSKKTPKSRNFTLTSDGKPILVYQGGTGADGTDKKVPRHPKGKPIINRAFVSIPLSRSPGKSKKGGERSE